MGRSKLQYNDDVGVTNEGEENRKVLLCLYFSIALIFTGMIVLGFGVHYIVRYQVYGALHFEKARCKVIAIRNTSVEDCGQQSICVSSVNQSGLTCNNPNGVVYCFTVTVTYSTQSHNDSVWEGNATYYNDIKAVWHKSECTFRSPSCDELQTSVEKYNSDVKKWSSMLHKNTTFKCFSGKENEHQAVGKLQYTTTIAFVVVLLPVLMICVGLGISGWSCFELYWSSKIEKEHQEKLNETSNAKRSVNNYSSTRPRVVSSAKKHVSESIGRKDTEKEASQPMLPETTA